MTLETKIERRDVVVPAHSVSGVSRRSAIMNTVVSIASLATSTAIASPSIAADGSTAGTPLSRARQMIGLLRTCYVREGFTLDETGAARALRYFENSGPEDEEAAVLSFAKQYGQSLDWILLGDPGGMICRLAGAANSGGDAELIALCDKALEADREASAAATRADNLFGRTSDSSCPHLVAAYAVADSLHRNFRGLTDKVEKMSAVTVEGLRAKARLLVQACWGPEGGLDRETTDHRLILSIVRDLTGRPDEERLEPAAKISAA
jgi:hypothetical protein